MNELAKIGDLVEIASPTHKSEMGYIFEIKGEPPRAYYMVKLFRAEYPVPIFLNRIKVISVS